MELQVDTELAAHAGWLRRLALSLAGADADASELVQQTYIAAWRQPPDDTRPLQFWLARVLRNAWRMRVRSESRRRAREAQAALAAPAAGDNPSPEELANRASVYRALADLVVGLDEPYRHTVLLRYFEGHTAAAIASMDGVPPGTVRWRLQEGLKRLRRALERQFGGREAWCAILFGAHGSKALAKAGVLPLGGLIMAKKSAVALLLGIAALVALAIGLSSSWWSDSEAGVAVNGAARRSAGPSGAGGGGARGAALTAARGAAGTAGATDHDDAPGLLLTPALAERDGDAAAGVIAGRVINWATGAGVAGAELSLVRDGAVVATLTTDARGSFTFAPQGVEPVRVAAITAEGYLPYAPEWGRSALLLTPRERWRVREATIYLVPAIDYTGVVIDGAGRPLAGADVRILFLPASEQELVTLPESFTTDAHGEFRFHAPDDILFEARKDGYAPARALLDTGAQISHRLTLRLEPALTTAAAAATLGTRSIGGVVVDERDTPLRGALVTAVPVAPAPLRTGAHAMAGNDGRFVLRGLDDGAYLLAAGDGVHAPSEAQVNAGTVDVRLVLHAGAGLRGRVLAANGAPVPCATVVVSRKEGLRSTAVRVESVIDPFGEFRIEALVSGDYELAAFASGFAPAAPRAVRATTAADAAPWVEILMSQGGSVTGNVHSRDGEPLAHARVSMEGAQGAGASAEPLVLSVVTNAAGEFQLDGLPNGRRSLYVAAYQHHPRIVAGFEVAEGARLGPIDVVLEPVAEGDTPRLELSGVGVKLEATTDALQVKEVMAGGGGAAAGLAAGDLIVAVDGRPVAELGFDGAIQTLRGPEGSEVLLRLRRAGSAGAEEDVRVVRRRIRS